MEKSPKKKAAPRRARDVYMTIRGKKVKSNPRVTRIFRLARKALKGLEVPPR